MLGEREGGKEPGRATSIVAAGTEAPSLDETLCFSRFSNGCCGDVAERAKKHGKKMVCPVGLVPAKECKGVGKGCD